MLKTFDWKMWDLRSIDEDIEQMYKCTVQCAASLPDCLLSVNIIYTF